LVDPVEHELFGKCREVTLNVRHEPSELRAAPWEKPQVTSERHNEGVAALVDAHGTGAPIRFGVMGLGVAVAQEECAYQSRGLRLHQEQPGVYAVYSYFKPV
jgi:hypothetical protein